MSKAIRVIHYEEVAVGRRIKSSKKRFSWKVVLDEEHYCIELFVSKFSGKKVIRVNGEKLFEGKKEGKVFHRSLEINTHSIIIIEVSKSYDLMIDGVSFKILQKHGHYGAVEEYGGTMSGQLVPENQADWERLAKPYEIITRENLNETTREKLPILKKAWSRNSIKNSVPDNRYIFGTVRSSLEAFQPDDHSSSKPFTTAHSAINITNPNNPFF